MPIFPLNPRAFDCYLAPHGTQSGTRRSRSAWLAEGISDAPETGGGLIVAALQLAIMLGGAFGGALFDHLSIAVTFIGGTVLLISASLVVVNGERLKTSS
jgi:predicted MFS family arabinose efflux permease